MRLSPRQVAALGQTFYLKFICYEQYILDFYCCVSCFTLSRGEGEEISPHLLGLLCECQSPPPLSSPRKHGHVRKCHSPNQLQDQTVLFLTQSMPSNAKRFQHFPQLCFFTLSWLAPNLKKSYVNQTFSSESPSQPWIWQPFQPELDPDRLIQ